MLGVYKARTAIRWSVTTAPTVEPLTSTEVKNYLKLETTEDDTLLTALISAVRQICENYCGIALLNQTCTFYLDDVPSGFDLIATLPVWPVSAITSVKTYDTARTATTVSSSDYWLDKTARPARLVFPEGLGGASLDFANALEIVATCGYGSVASAVPATLRAAMLAHIAWIYQNRGDAATGELPPTVKIVYDQYRNVRV